MIVTSCKGSNHAAFFFPHNMKPLGIFIDLLILGGFLVLLVLTIYLLGEFWFPDNSLFWERR